MKIVVEIIIINFEKDMHSYCRNHTVLHLLKATWTTVNFPNQRYDIFRINIAY